jgi:hypothetical protein
MKVLKLWLLAIVAAAPWLLFTGHAAAQGPYSGGSNGIDVSYPNCKVKLPASDFGIVGVTGGVGFKPNPCLAAEASHFKNLSFYVNTGYPGQISAMAYTHYPNDCQGSDLNCVAYNYGYNAGTYAISYASGLGLWSSTWWLDVETMNTWTNDYAQNIQSLQGEADALTTAGVANVGVYSTTFQWGVITGSWKNNLPSWGATTWNSAKQAKTYCTGHEFTGGSTWLLQYQGKNLDQDYAC